MVVISNWNLGAPAAVHAGLQARPSQRRPVRARAVPASCAAQVGRSQDPSDALDATTRRQTFVPSTSLDPPATTRRSTIAAAALALSLPLGREARAAGIFEQLREENEAPLIEKRFEREAYVRERALERDAAARAELEQLRLEGERVAMESQSTNGLLCATPFGIDVVGIVESLGLVGAVGGGLIARQRKQELEELNDKLRAINVQLRAEARAGTVYAPGLTYAPPPSDRKAYTMVDSKEVEVVVTEKEEEAQKMPIQGPVCNLDALPNSLRNGRQLLNDNKPSKALVYFEKAEMLARQQEDKVQERRAVRGKSAAYRALAQYPKAIGQLERVLQLSEEMEEFTGDQEAYGTIADIYTETGDFEKAGRFYDKYISMMQ